MKKLIALSALLVGLAFALPGPKPAAAIVYPPCDQICTTNPATKCSCPGTVHNVTCGTWQTAC
jgi:hypothetical protein